MNCTHEIKHTQLLPKVLGEVSYNYFTQEKKTLSEGKEASIITYCADCGLKLKEVIVDL